MISLATVANAFLQGGYRLIKVLRFGNADVQTPDAAAPHGVDSSPVKDMVAVFAETSTKGEPVIVGYLNPEQLAQPGELRLYGTDAAGNLKNYVWLKGNGDILLGGDADNLVRFKALKTALDNHTTFLNQQLALIATGISAGGGSYTPDTASININNAKAPKVKTS